MLFSQIIPPLPSPIESKSLFYTSVKLESIIQSEVSQKEKHQFRTLMHIYGIYKDGNDNPICKTEKETDYFFMWTIFKDFIEVVTILFLF